MLEWSALWLTIKLAALTSVCLIFIATPIAWWLSTTRSRWATAVDALVAMPLVLPPTVLGFYFLLALSPQSSFGQWWLGLTGQQLTFSFSGLVVASIVYSLPFAVQPLQASFAGIDPRTLEAGEVLGASPIDRFISLVLPLSSRGYLTALILAFAHTVGEFGVVLMIGGNIPGETRVVSIAIYEAVETLNYDAAHTLSLILIGFSFVVLALTYGLNRHFARPLFVHNPKRESKRA